jgi:hypothetical protein
MCASTARPTSASAMLAASAARVQVPGMSSLPGLPGPGVDDVGLLNFQRLFQRAVSTVWIPEVKLQPF